MIDHYVAFEEFKNVSVNTESLSYIRNKVTIQELKSSKASFCGQSNKLEVFLVIGHPHRLMK